MKPVFLDAEFTGLHKQTTLISLALVSACARSFYAESINYSNEQVTDWIRENVIKNLTFKGVAPFVKTDTLGNCTIRGNNKTIAAELTKWINNLSPDDNSIELWADVAAHDVILFQDLFGGAVNVPKPIYYIIHDFATALKTKGINPDINRETFAFGDNYEPERKHNSLHDAKVLKACHEKLFTNSI